MVFDLWLCLPSTDRNCFSLVLWQTTRSLVWASSVCCYSIHNCIVSQCVLFTSSPTSQYLSHHSTFYIQLTLKNRTLPFTDSICLFCNLAFLLLWSKTWNVQWSIHAKCLNKVTKQMTCWCLEIDTQQRTRSNLHFILCLCFLWHK